MLGVSCVHCCDCEDETTTTMCHLFCWWDFICKIFLTYAYVYNYIFVINNVAVTVMLRTCTVQV